MIADDERNKDLTQEIKEIILEKDKYSIKIRNIRNLSSPNVLLQYLKNEKRSYGGSVSEFVFNTNYDYATATFENSTVAEKVLKKMEHTLEGQTIYVSKLPPICKNRIYVENAPPWVPDDSLKYCIESYSNSLEVERLIYCEDRKRLVVCFKNEIDIEEIRHQIGAHPLRHLYKANIFSVPLPDAILLYGNVPPSDDSVILAFEEFLADQPDVSCPTVRLILSNDDKSLTVVSFEDYKVIPYLNNFITINGLQFFVAPFYDCLGWTQMTDGDAEFLLECSLQKVRKNLSLLQVEFLTKPVGYDYVVNQLINRNYQCQFEISRKEQCLFVTSPTKGLQETCANFILSCLTSFEIVLDKPNLELFYEEKSKLMELVDETDIKQWFCFSLSETNKLCVVAASSERKRLKNLIERFFDENSICTEIVVGSNICGTYIKKYYEKKLAVFFRKKYLSFTPEGQISATGRKQDVNRFKEIVREVMLANVEVTSCTLQQCNWLNIFNSGHGLKDINAIARETSTVIQLIQPEIMWPIGNSVAATGSKPVDGENYVCALPSIVAKNLLPAPVALAQLQPDNKTAYLCINGCDINIVQGDIINLANQYDVIVTSLAPNSLLEDGSQLSRAIARAAGSTYVHDVNHNYPNGILNEPVAFTGAGQLGCKYVFHVSCPVWSTVSGVNDLTKRIMVCMNEMVAKKVTSIAFPAIGTGGFNYPADEVAKAMFGTVENWLKSNVNQNVLKSVSFVVLSFDTTTLESFQQQFKLQLNSSGPISSVPAVAPAENALFEIGTLTVEIIKGNLEDQDTDCVFSATVKGCSDLYKNLPNALKAEGGDLLALALNQYTEVSFKNKLLPVSTNGVLHFKTVMFIEDFCVTNLIEWRYCFYNALKEANKLGQVSIATPPLKMRMACGTSTKYSETLRAIQIYSSTVRNSDLRLIRFVVPRNETFLEFCKEVVDLIEYDKTRSPVNSHIETFDWLLKGFNGIGFVKDIVQNQEESSLTFSICGPVSGIQLAKTLLRNAYDAECTERRIIKNVVASLSDEMIFKLEMKAEKYGVKMYTDRSINTITVKGLRAVEFQEFLSEFLDKFAEEISDVPVKWYKRKDHRSSWQLMNFRIAQLEKEFNRVSGKGRILFEFDCTVSSMIDFNQMVILSGDTKTILFYLKRKELIDVTPVEWNWDWSIKNPDPYKLITLETDSPEFVTVRDAIQQTEPNVRIEKIERVENPVKYQQYVALKQQMEQSNPGSVQIERKLFHGTEPKNIPGICSTGFNRSLCGYNGTRYGRGGTYFARDFFLGRSYGSPVIYANVLTGVFAIGNSSMKAAPFRDPSKGVEFDSVVDNVIDPKIFVVFSDNHAYPSYLITYR